MPTLKQLQKENRKLKAIAKSREDFNKLQKENKALKNPRTAAFKKLMKKAVITGGKKTLKYLDDLTRPVPVRRRRLTTRHVPVRKRKQTKRRRR